MMRAQLWALGWLAAACGGAAFAGCAANEEPEPNSDQPDAQTLPSSDGATDASSDGCVNDVCVRAECTTTDFCMAEYPVSRLVALNAVWGSGPSDVWAVGTGGTILHGDGSKFVSLGAPSGDVNVAVWGTSSSDVWILGPSFPARSGGFVDGGASFEPRRGASWDPANQTTGRLWAGRSAGARVWLGGEASRRFGAASSFWMLDGEDAGTPTWSRSPACTAAQPCTPAVRALWAADGDTAWAVGRNGQAFFFDASTGGDAEPPRWLAQDSTTRDDLEAVWGSGPSNVWAVGHGGRIVHTSKGAATWAESPSGTTRDLYAVWGSGPSDVWAVGELGTILHYDGSAWTQASFDVPVGEVPTRLLGVWGSGPDDVWIVGEGILLHRTATSRRRP